MTVYRREDPLLAADVNHEMSVEVMLGSRRQFARLEPKTKLKKGKTNLLRR